MGGWVAGGCVFAALPLLAALLLADVSLNKLSRQAETLADNSLRIAQLGTGLRDTLGNLERNTWQYLALQDPTLGEIVGRRLSETDNTLKLLLLQEPAEPLRTKVLQVQAGVRDVELAWSAHDLNGIGDRVHELLKQTDPIIDLARAAVDDKVEKFRGETAATHRLMGISVLALIPLAGLLALGFSRAVTRPLREMGRSVAALGHGHYDDPVNISFPHELRRLGERLDWLRRRLALLDADKDRFLRHVSHELKTPLASLLEGAALLNEGSLGRLTDDQAEAVQILAESAHELEGLIENLLTYAEWRRGYRQMELEWFDIAGLIEEVVQAHRLPMSARGLSVELDLDCSRLFGQRAQLRSALDNLFTNALKHAPAGSVIEICAGAEDGSCELSVRDQGRGVPDDEKKRIFEPFVRGTEAEERGIRGAGVGLSIVDETAHAHGGAALVEDALPGARFKLVWPCPQH
ncbi:MAG: ATP-binding protein [Stenotrophobium sp.]